MGSKTTAPLTFISGVVIGTTAGLLFAPHKGKVTRSKIKHQVENKKEMAEEKTEGVKEILSEAKQKLEKLAKD